MPHSTRDEIGVDGMLEELNQLLEKLDHLAQQQNGHFHDLVSFSGKSSKLLCRVQSS
jgi:hypothetical protein